MCERYLSGSLEQHPAPASGSAAGLSMQNCPESGGKKYRLNTAAKRTCELTCVLEELEDCIPAPSSWEVEEQIEARELAGNLEEFLDTLKERDRLVFCADTGLPSR